MHHVCRGAMTKKPDNADMYPLELSGEQMRRLVDVAMDFIVEHIETLGEQPAHGLDGAEAVARGLIEREPPNRPSPYAELLEVIVREAAPRSLNTAGPGFLAYIPGGGIFHSAVADLVANSLNRYVGASAPGPALAQIEANVVRWFCRIVGFGAGSGGFLSSGGSLANFSAIVAARRSRFTDDFSSGTIYCSSQVHHSVLKSAALAGFSESAVRSVPVDRDFRMDIEALSAMLAADQADGRTPCLIVGSAGTTNTGAVDDLAHLADLSSEFRAWFHVDAAYGGFFMLTERGRAVMRGIELADSVTLDPHKGLFLPYGTGALIVRDVDTLRRAHSATADYMPAMQTDPDFVDFCEISPELSRDFRGLRVWLPLKMHGMGVFAESLNEKLDLTDDAYQVLRSVPGLEIVAPQLSVVVFRLRPSGLAPEELNRLNQQFIRRINDLQNIHVTGTTLDGLFAIRICVLSFRTHADHLEIGLEDIRRAAAELLSERSGPAFLSL